VASLQPVRGTHDLLAEDQRKHHFVIAAARQAAAHFGYAEIATPIFEFTEVFKRTLGETSDVVSKEMYSFQTKGEKEISLRPEGTAGIARAFISNGLAQTTPCKFFYQGPMFRHEAPQAGRYRQFHQIGVELLGPETALGDIEVISLGDHILKSLGLRDRTTLEINTLGDQDSRQAYRAALVQYFQGYKDQLSEDSQNRLERNPLRILDSKEESDRALVAEAPLFDDYLNSTSKDFFAQVCDALADLEIPFQRNPRLVRGLDYYCHTAFEFTTDALGSQGTVLAGGRYDGLIAMMGGPKTAGVGWAAGIERLALLADPVLAAPRPVTLIPVTSAQESLALKVVTDLRRQGFFADLGFSGNVTKRLKRAHKNGARAALILGEDELAEGKITFRDLESGEETRLPLEGLGVSLLEVCPDVKNSVS